MKKTAPKTAADEPSEIKSELLRLTGSTAGYHTLMNNIQAQLTTIAKTRGKLDLKTNTFVPVPSAGKGSKRRPAGRRQA